MGVEKLSTPQYAETPEPLFDDDFIVQAQQHAGEVMMGNGVSPLSADADIAEGAEPAEPTISAAQRDWEALAELADKYSDKYGSVRGAIDHLDPDGTIWKRYQREQQVVQQEEALAKERAQTELNTAAIRAILDDSRHRRRSAVEKSYPAGSEELQRALNEFDARERAREEKRRRPYA